MCTSAESAYVWKCATPPLSGPTAGNVLASENFLWTDVDHNDDDRDDS